MVKLTYKQRKKLPSSAFAIDGLARKYPIHDIEHARNALARVSAYGSKEEKRIVRAAVYHRYPELRPAEYRYPVIRRKAMRITPKTPRLK